MLAMTTSRATFSSSWRDLREAANRGTEAVQTCPLGGRTGPPQRWSARVPMEQVE